MRRLILMRHGKTVAAAAAGDRARHLNARGLTEAALAGQRLWRLAAPDFALVSDARRTRETFDRIVEANGREMPHRFEPALYGASEKDILGLVVQTPDDVSTLLVIGHNPGLGALARSLAGDGTGRERHDLDAHFPTSAFVIIGLAAPDWADADQGGALEAFVMTSDE